MASFHHPINNLSATVASAHAVADSAIVLSDGTGFGIVFPLIVTAVRAGSVLAIFNVIGRVGNTLSVSGAIEGTSDVVLNIGDVIEMRPTALAFTEIHDAINSLPATVASGTPGRVPFETTGGLLTDSDVLTYTSGVLLIGQPGGTAGSTELKLSNNGTRSLIESTTGYLSFLGPYATTYEFLASASRVDVISVYTPATSIIYLHQYGLSIGTTGQVGFTNSAGYLAATVGLASPEAGVIRVSDGSTGNGCLAPGNFATGSRPTVTTVGAMCYDTSLHLPIWWNGTVWKDAAGNTV